MAARFGWSAVRGPAAMSWRELLLALQVIAEESYGSPARRAVYDQAAREEAAAAASIAALDGRPRP